MLLSTISTVINPCSTVLPVASPKICEDFLQFFVDKMALIRGPTGSSVTDPFASLKCSAVLDRFELVSLSPLSEVVQHLQPTTCSLNCIPSRLPKEVFNAVGSAVLRIINC